MDVEHSVKASFEFWLKYISIQFERGLKKKCNDDLAESVVQN